MLLIGLEVFSCSYLFIFTKKVFINKLVFFWLLIFIVITMFINGYWQIGAILNLIVLIIYSFLIINVAFFYNKQRILASGFFMSILLLLSYFIFGEIILSGFNFYKNLYYNIGNRSGAFGIVDSTLTIPLLAIMLLFSLGYLKKKIYRYCIIIFVLTSLILLERRGPLLIALIYLILFIFNLKSKIIYKAFLYIPLVITVGFTLFLEKVQKFLLFIDVIQNRGVEASNEERMGLLIHFFQDLQKFNTFEYLTGHIDTFKNIHPEIVYYHPHNTLMTLLFLSGIIPVVFFIGIHIKLVNELLKIKLYNELRMLLVFYLLCYTESILNNFSLFTILFLSFIYFYFIKLHYLKKNNYQLAMT
jgi:hypothetical protein